MRFPYNSNMAVCSSYIGEKTERLKGNCPLYKVLLSTVCVNNCYYCAFRRDRDVPRNLTTPERMAMKFYNRAIRGKAGGLFLSSGIIGNGIKTQDRIIETAYYLRKKLNYRGYLHLKIMPNSDEESIAQTIFYANRISVNLEAPSPRRLSAIAPEKNIELFKMLKNLSETVKKLRYRYPDRKILPSGISTQFVISPLGEKDIEYLRVTEKLYRSLGLRVVYFSAFFPVPKTPLDSKKPVPKLRERRLYQASILLRDYGFKTNELPLKENGNLYIHNDPKYIWAKNNLIEPIEITTAEEEILLRIPGIGPKRAKNIIKNRKNLGIYGFKKLGIPRKSLPFILFKGKIIQSALSLF